MNRLVTGRVPQSARLGTEASQRTFRLLLDAFSRPGRPIDLGTIATEFGVEPVLLPILALADLDTPVAVVDTPERVATHSRLVSRSTGAPIVGDPDGTGLDDADLVLAGGSIAAAQIARLRRGDAWAPERGARLALRCERLAAERGEVGITVTGPGARGGRTFGVDGVDAAVFEEIGLANAEHPAGIDTWLVDAAGHCVGIPRSSQIEITNGVH